MSRPTIEPFADVADVDDAIGHDVTTRDHQDPANHHDPVDRDQMMDDQTDAALAGPDQTRPPDVARSDGVDVPQHADPRRALVVAAVLSVVIIVAVAVIASSWSTSDPPPDRAANASIDVLSESATLPTTGPFSDQGLIGVPDTIDITDIDAGIDTGIETDATTLDVFSGFHLGTSIGDIDWTVIHGDTASLPQRVASVRGVTLQGVDDLGGHWTSANGGLDWTNVFKQPVERQVGDTTWVVRTVDGTPTLTRLSDADEQRVELGAGGDAPEGFGVERDLATGPAGGFPIELEGGIFIVSSTTVGVPWADVPGAGNGEAFRVRVEYGSESLTAAGGDFHEMPVTPFTLEPIDERGLFAIVAADGSVAWTVDLSEREGVATSPIRAMASSTASLWLGWDGEQFVPVESPWPAEYSVDVVVVDGGVIARSVGPLNIDAALWRSVDGRTWLPVALPDDPAGDVPLPIYDPDGVDGSDPSRGEAIVSVFTADGPTHWSTRDGRLFERLPDVPGIVKRSLGTFGWVVPDPRSGPRIRVSPDGWVWDTIELSDLLGVTESRWDLSIEATAVAGTIYVVADRDGSRTLLIGDVQRRD